MKILMIECTADEMRENRTVMDTITDVFNKCTDSMFGVSVDKETEMNEEKEECEEF